MSVNIEIGKEYRVDCPFVRIVFDWWDEDGQTKTLSWKPGIIWEACGPEDCQPVAHGMGFVIYRVVDVHKLPKPYPARAFFIRQWVTPDGTTFGKKALRIMTVEAFRRRLSGYGVDGGYGLVIEDISEAEKLKLLEVA